LPGKITKRPGYSSCCVRRSVTRIKRVILCHNLRLPDAEDGWLGVYGTLNWMGRIGGLIIARIGIKSLKKREKVTKGKRRPNQAQ
jgi:hypothetical protein